MKPQTFHSSHLEKDYFSIPEMNRATDISYELKESKDRDNNRIWELTLFTDEYGIFDTYTYYNESNANEDVETFEKLDIVLTEA